MALTKRLTKGSALTYQEGDDNLQFLLDQANAAIAAAASAVATVSAIADSKLDTKLQVAQAAMSPNEVMVCSGRNIFKYDIGQDSVLDFTDAVQGQNYNIIITQINGGGHALTFQGSWKGVNSLTITQEDGAMDLISCFFDGQNMVVINHNYNL